MLEMVVSVRKWQLSALLSAAWAQTTGALQPGETSATVLFFQKRFITHFIMPEGASRRRKKATRVWIRMQPHEVVNMLVYTSAEAKDAIQMRQHVVSHTVILTGLSVYSWSQHQPMSVSLAGAAQIRKYWYSIPAVSSKCITLWYESGKPRRVCELRDLLAAHLASAPTEVPGKTGERSLKRPWSPGVWAQLHISDSDSELISKMNHKKGSSFTCFTPRLCCFVFCVQLWEPSSGWEKHPCPALSVLHVSAHSSDQILNNFIITSS